MSNHGPHSRLSYLMIRGEELLGDAARDVGCRRATPQQCRDVAESLEQLAGALREHAATLPVGELDASESTVIEGAVDD
ncbi:hypothetical protein FHR84_004094 [Actinopolyspora biskrensis]|uniref:Uncharacterized protein n=1 Tax=Actinopolyspora biskrensis TaxID=1470178 RepID=A0A852ZB28_9ACTN|nr:hypothetical protein [Actinopolyspora biskrensis]NYH80726.1 hypothetical protein [Actinopolyspora biskrensis]